ncbi:hypothetical protein SAMN05421507_12318 [Lentzea jiangxiensis]|uniref:Uncharacterized protein n=1 Tax=Lentzea jiangxiensis TaxID=641025 RepID=A0A1H0WTG0_9PSEU|nr:hypothetical protein SAMN05421507_12318 [Lentzea jiangxiensis]
MVRPATLPSGEHLESPPHAGSTAKPGPLWSNLFGPPPRVRGAPRPGAPHADGAGTTPRVRGALRQRHYGDPEFWTTPRVRGAPAQRGRLLRLDGTTPARAGSTESHRRPIQLTADHPRMQEHAAICRLLLDASGPPLRVRGALGEHQLDVRRRRTTPARAGAPRRRGCSGRDGRTTPARAGSTARSLRTCSPSRDHPRACGEHPVRELVVDDDQGLPPRVWGTPGAGTGRRR